ncbi:hypothetical protein Pure05_16630 [Paenarthrobacter ureafaciens]|nr:hypothetical protein NicSoilE8_08580 [Arthrobacter sp. NicSoilE8]GLU59150.1 hypothetical protein Pure01_16630 [Paenarthrobacter ureafaciens]GLU63418.1 hypothetical protein Pure02_16680 [Paenarthrobacter ureafaciens]GLU67922.1 hypothetical protein Pure03_18980 [Paenarthrobacter ureafaciens]GLU71953.1 hypothetical protein Pure04_16680 [Paenarthrobacter ureafaciens]
MRDDDDSHPLCIEAPEFLDDSFRVGDVQVACRFVGKQNFWVSREGARQCQTLTFTSGQISTERILTVKKSHPLEGRADTQFSFSASTALNTKSKGNVPGRRLFSHHMRCLKDEAEHLRPQRISLPLTQPGHIVTVDVISAIRRPVQEGKDIQQRGLS